jgi:sulfide:quinone oxidoreductase
VSHYNGYGSCPLTVERGKIVLAEFGYGGKLLPSFPALAHQRPAPVALAWILKESDPAPGLLEGHAARPRVDGRVPKAAHADSA